VLVGIMLDFMYTGEYAIPGESDEYEHTAEAMEECFAEASSTPTIRDSATTPAPTMEQSAPLAPSMNQCANNKLASTEANEDPHDQEFHSLLSATKPNCPCTCHTYPKKIPPATRQTILARRSQTKKLSLIPQTWDSDGRWELQAHGQWTCCHGFLHGFGTDKASNCELPCICSAHEQGLVAAHMSVHALMYATADYFAVPALKDRALETFAATAHVHFRSGDFAQAVRDVFGCAMPEGDDVTPRTLIIDILVEFRHCGCTSRWSG
jgi:hypothetical protein